MAFHRPLHPPRSQIRRREEVICCGRLMRCDASPPVLVSVRLYHLCSLVPSPVVARVRSYLRLCSPVFAYICTFSHPSSSAFSFSSVLVSQPRHLFLSLSPVICLVSLSVPVSLFFPPSVCPPSFPIPSAHNPHIRPTGRFIRTKSAIGRSKWTNSVRISSKWVANCRISSE